MPPPPPPPPGPAPKPSGPAYKHDGSDLNSVLFARVDKVEAIEPVRPSTPPDFGPEVFHEVHFDWINASDLYNLLQRAPVAISSVSRRLVFLILDAPCPPQFGSQLLVIDVRSNAAYDSEHVRSSISVDWEALECADMLDCEATVHQRFWHRRFFNVVLYDDESTPEAEATTLASFSAALQTEKRCSRTVHKLRGGLRQFMEAYPFLVKGHPAFTDAEFPSEIKDGFLFLGSWKSASNLEALKALNITRIVNATASCDMPFDQQAVYLHCPLDDKPDHDLSQFFGDFIAFVRKAQGEGQRVLVHCQMGMSRSSALAILWMMDFHDMTLKQAYDYVHSKRPYINPNPGFLKQLGEWEHANRGSSTIRFPEDDAPITLITPYEWLQADGTWKMRVLKHQ
ncbi:uncharacterized protein MONBRDRAFT_25952 [Monosiga brevicollis MX1]|uniref:Protein-tyrosine-phosphatase n=1 Tax=Monosiga brevicollis TaxID=81824 RepID=A9V0Y3_MONBE|nr:uncharacterized protein MONBRDRAFT_25952 [Monosiga brevicollis MX1]EDQ88713.1 predicted protein [Monosiga brevicollis MX1]|eukprot:XP_001746326.1 hypothetical protein [Monosiga brevicollis MX1]